MSSTLEAESTLTDRYQTTVPEAVRRALGLGKRDKIHYVIRPNGEVVLSRATSGEAEDPVMVAFLDFLAQDMTAHPNRLTVVSADLAEQVQSLVSGVEVDWDAPLSADDE